MSQRTTAILAAILVFLLVGSYVVSTRQKTPGIEPTPSRPASWVELTNGQISSISILDTTSGQTLAAQRTGETSWSLQSPTSAPADSQQLEMWLAQWQYMQAQHTLTPTTGLEEFGLARPALIITFTTQSGSPPTTIIHIGNRAPAVAGYYAQQAGRATIGVVETWLVDETRQLIATPPLAPTTPANTPTP